MTELASLDLPEIDVSDPALHGEAFHELMARTAERSWLARLPIGYAVLDREASEHFLRTRAAVFPAQLIVELYGVEPGPLREEIDSNVLHVDGDVHARLRRLVNPSFTPRASDAWRPAMRGFLADLWSQVEGTSCDAVAALARPYPALTVAALMGAPAEDHERLAHWSAWIQRQFDGPSMTTQRAQIEQAVVEFYAWCEELLARKRAEPGEDLVSQLVAAEQDGDRLSAHELKHLVLDVLIGGVDTTQAQLAHALCLFAEHPDQWSLLAREPERVPRAVDEVLRHEPITPFTARLLTQDVVFRDVDFPAGTLLMVAAVTANRDGAGPPEFDIAVERPGARLLTFGAGIHHCLGMNLARAELEEALAFLAPRMPGLRLDGAVRYGTVQGIYDLVELPIAWDRTGTG